MSVAEPSPTTRSPHTTTETETETSFLDSNVQPTLNSISNSNISGTDDLPIPPSSSSSSANPLNEFAQQVLGSESDAHNLLDLGRSSLGYSIISEEQTFNDLLQNEERREQAQAQAQKDRLNGEHGFHEGDEDHHHHGHEIDPNLVEDELTRQIQVESNNQHHQQGEGEHAHVIIDEDGNRITLDIPLNDDGNHDKNDTLPSIPTQNNNNNSLNLVYGGRIGKRKRVNHAALGGNGTPSTEEIITDADGNPVEPHEYVRLKKDSHKEVERRRREAINEGINEIAQLVPGGMDKQGKGMTLKRAATYLIELTEKIRIGEEEISKRDIEKQDLEAQLAHLQVQMQEERDRSMRFETSWREAEDRAASSNFELESLRAELEQLKNAQSQS